MASNRGADQGYRPGVGWIGFAAVVMGFAGATNIISGLSAIIEDEVFIAGGERGALVLDLTGWGWVHLLLGALLVAVAVALFMGATWASYTAIVILIINMVTQVMFMPFYPFWSLLVIGLDLMVLWAIFTHGEERKRA